MDFYSTVNILGYRMIVINKTLLGFTSKLSKILLSLFSPFLYRAYEHAYNLLEKTFLPLFHQSDDVSRLSFSIILFT